MSRSKLYWSVVDYIPPEYLPDYDVEQIVADILEVNNDAESVDDVEPDVFDGIMRANDAIETGPRYMTVVEYDTGASEEYFGINAAEAVNVAISNFSGGYENSGAWFRVDVFTVDAKNEQSAWSMWENSQLPEDGDVLHLDSDMRWEE